MSWTHNSTTYRRAALYKRAARFLLLVLKVARIASICFCVGFDRDRDATCENMDVGDLQIMQMVSGSHYGAIVLIFRHALGFVTN